MKIFKFGGASVKDAKGVKNIIKVLQSVGIDNVLIVISAMGKMTNAFEKIAKAYHVNDVELPLLIDNVRTYHQTIAKGLFAKKEHAFFLK